MVKPHRAPVRPRVVLDTTVLGSNDIRDILRTGDSLWLEDVVSAEHTIGIRNQPGAGTTTALAHIAAVMPERFCFDGDPAFISTAPAPAFAGTRLYRLAPWTIEDCYEYLKATHPDRARALTARLVTDPDFGRLQGNAELLSAVMNRMADDADLVDIRSAILRAVSPDPAVVRDVAARCFANTMILNRPARDVADLPDMGPHWRMTRHWIVWQMLLAEHVITQLSDDLFEPFPLIDPLAYLIDEVALGISRNPVALNQIRYLASHGRKEIQPLCASIAHATKTGWRPDERRSINLDGARLDGADWPGIALWRASLVGARLRNASLPDAPLGGARLTGADLSGASLPRAVLTLADLIGCRFAGADLRGATADRVDFQDVDLSGAFLEFAKLEACQFNRTNLRGSSLNGARLAGARFHLADLTGASLVGADLSDVHLASAHIEGADFSNANLEGAILTGLALHRAKFAGARFDWAHAGGACLEGMDLPNVSFEQAFLPGADFTYSVMRNACFRAADLSMARLAHVDWEGADLRDASLNCASFHLGTSRSGLIFSTTPGEGSKTGFYTDEFTDRTRAPEEIRKANLRGADLRGAKLDGVDLYLVDLRGARLSSTDVAYAKKCGAILDGGAEE